MDRFFWQIFSQALGAIKVIFLLVFASSAAQALQYELTADEIFFDEKSGEFRAVGSIELVYQDKKIWADRIFYDSRKQTIHASGNVVFHDRAKGTTLFATKIIFDRDVNRQEVESVALRFKGNNRLRARYFNAGSGAQSELHDMVYSSCGECVDKNGKEKSPLWQLRSRKTLMDSEKKTLTHHGLYVDVRGRTILYLPKLRHVYDDTVPLSGILAPIYGSNSTHKSFYAQGFYYNFSQAKDMTLVPVISHEDRHYFSAQYRHALSRGLVESHVTVGSGETATENDDVPIQDSVFARIKFNNQLSRYTRISGNLHYLDNRDFFVRYRQNTNFNQHGVGAPSYYQDNLLVEQFIGRDYLRFESRYQHRIQEQEAATFPAAQMQYHGGIYQLWGGYVSAYGEWEELKRTAIERRGRTRLNGKAQYRKDIWLGNKTKIEFATKYRGSQMQERAEMTTDEKFAHRSVSHYYGRVIHDFSHIGKNYVLGFAPQIMGHGSKGAQNNELFVNEDSTEFIPDMASLLAFEPLGNGEDIQQAGTRDAAGGRIYYQHNQGFYAELGYARARIFHHDETTKEVLQIESGKTDHASSLLLFYRNFRFQEDVLLEKNDKRLLAASGVVEIQSKRWDIALNHDYLNEMLFLSNAEREMHIQQQTIDDVSESARISIHYRPQEIWRFSLSSLYDMREKQFTDEAKLTVSRQGDCLDLSLEILREYDGSEAEDSVTFSLALRH